MKFNQLSIKKDIWVQVFGKNYRDHRYTIGFNGEYLIIVQADDIGHKPDKQHTIRITSAIAPAIYKWIRSKRDGSISKALLSTESRKEKNVSYIKLELK